MYEGIPATPPRLANFWTAVRDRLRADATLIGLLGGADRITKSYEPDYEGSENVQWQRLVIVPVTTAFPVEDTNGGFVLAPFLVRVDIHLPGEVGDPLVKLELVQNRAYALLHGWLPAPIVGLSIHLHVYRATTPQAAPLYDPEMDMQFTSSEYRVVAESPDIS